MLENIKSGAQCCFEFDPNKTLCIQDNKKCILDEIPERFPSSGN
jgi:hypothetical protein